MPVPAECELLSTRSWGAGPDLVLLHGWGMHGGIWQDLAEDLGRDFRVTAVDLPGHGRSPRDGRFGELDEVCTKLLQVAPPKAIWLGWSLGGMLAWAVAARAPARVAALITVAASPRFVRSADWPWAMEPQLLQDFGRELEHDYRRTLQRFLALQTRGAEAGRETLKRLHELSLQDGEPAPQALRDGLALLAGCDLRPDAASLDCPTLLLFGERDTLVPAAAAPAIAAYVPRARSVVIPAAGHAPFLSHPATCAMAIRRFTAEGPGA